MKSENAKAKRMVLAAAVVLLVAAVWVLATEEGGTTGLISLILIVVGGLLLVMAMMMGMRSLDELQRRIHLEALAMAFGGISLVAFIQIGLDEWGRPWVLEPGTFLLVLDGLWLLGYFWAQRRYR